MPNTTFARHRTTIQGVAGLRLCDDWHGQRLSLCNVGYSQIGCRQCTHALVHLIA